MNCAEISFQGIANSWTVFMLTASSCLLTNRVPMQSFVSNVESGYRILDRTGEDVTDASIKK